MKNRLIWALVATFTVLTLSGCTSDEVKGSGNQSAQTEVQFSNSTNETEGTGSTTESGADSTEVESSSSAESSVDSSSVESTTESGTESTADNSSESSTPNEASDSILADEVKIGSESYKLGCTVKDFLDNGWAVQPENEELEGIATAIGAKLVKGDTEIGFTPFNNTTKTKKLEECLVVGIDVNQSYVKDIDNISYMGITLNKSTAEDVKNKFGEPSSEYHSDSSDYSSYTYEEDIADNIQFTESKGVITRIYLKTTSRNTLRALMD